MGLFTSKKNLCPVCGEPTPRLLPTKVEGTPICKTCANKVFLPEGMINQMSIDEFTEYITYYDDNQSLRDQFSETYKCSLGFLTTDFVIDATNRLMKFKNLDEAMVFEASCVKKFRILEDGKTLFESEGNTLRCYETGTEEKIDRLYTLVEQFKMRRQQYERMERLQRREEETARQRGESYHASYNPCPFFEGHEPVAKFYIELEMEHPYWNNYRGEMKAPTFSSTNPDVGDYFCEYKNAIEKLHELAMNLMQIMSPGAKEVRGNGSQVTTDTVARQTAVAGGDAIEEIKKYKELLDAGILTEDEFAVKKKQLLGL